MGVDEGTKTGSGTAVLDLLLKGGTMNEDEPGKWSKAPGYEKDRNYVFGDRKSIEMMQAFKNDIQKRGVSLSAASA